MGMRKGCHCARRCNIQLCIELMIEKAGGDRKGATVCCLRHLCLSERKVMFSRAKMVFTRLKISSKAADVAEASEKVKAVLRQAQHQQKSSLTWLHLWSPLQTGLWGWCSSLHTLLRILGVGCACN